MPNNVKLPKFGTVAQ